MDGAGSLKEERLSAGLRVSLLFGLAAYIRYGLGASMGRVNASRTLWATWKVPRGSSSGPENLTEPRLCWLNLLGQMGLQRDGYGPAVFVRVEQIYFMRGHAKET